MALRVGFEPTTYRLTAGCSTVELPKNITGDFLLSQDVTVQVPSALRGLTSVFGMETGVSLLLSSPDENYFAKYINYLSTYLGQVLDLLVSISFKYYYSFTLDLSTRWSSWSLTYLT